MDDYRDYLQQMKKILKEEEQSRELSRIMPLRSHILEQAEGSIRDYFRRQLLDALRRFHEEEPPKSGDSVGFS